jgi:transcription antitermination protein NusB
VNDAAPSNDQETRRRVRQARTQGRALAVQMAYSCEQNRFAADAVLMPADDLEAVDGEARSFAEGLLAGMLAERTAIDAAIDKRLENWTLSRLSVIDRAILRLSAYELLYRPDTPPKVTINEGIELAKRFGSEAKTTRLVNGVLDRIAREHQLTEQPTPPAGDVRVDPV